MHGTRSTVRVILATALVAGLSVACGSSEGEATDSEPAASDSSTTTVAKTRAEGAPITEPVCDFLHVTDSAASAAFREPVTVSSAVGSDDQDGGSCTIEPVAPNGRTAKIAISVFPMDEADFDGMVRALNVKRSPTGNPLWTELARRPDLGEHVYTFRSPTGGWDSVWAYVDGYRVGVSDYTKVDVDGRTDDVELFAENVFGAMQS